ncbi:NlpC/P60 family protein [Allokutzneria sp. A3M-2-11 16]|uniref:NlpC/P60 family protein n=1 Tax=Allokutzneria sp. A3M-2-11 16 TaxID=2962043 RepID=UPI0020B6869B|nr:NlpC/P60 family protein [Allokutzneria sp. A3M-2-11 16]MCP3802864.1 NlpC/P60 family protein [Allokutzneria sp. A3M-2-11 16]
MSSNRLKRSMRGAATAGAVLAAVALVGPAGAAPDPSTASEALKQLKAVNEEAEKLTEALHKANDELKAKEGEVTKANEDLVRANAAGEQARRQEGELRKHVDQLASSQFQGSRMSHISALLLSRSPRDLLEQLSMVDLITVENKTAMDKLNATIAQAGQAAGKADEAKTSAAKAAQAAAGIKRDLDARTREAKAKQDKAEQQLARLSRADRNKLGDAGLDIDISDLPEGGIGAAALRHAVTQKGKMYGWGQVGPERFDCSGLMVWAFRKVGVSLPRSSAAQSRVGTSIPAGNRAAWRPGDLLFFAHPGEGVSHVAIYVGNGNQFHASQPGEPLKYGPVQKNLVGVRRIGT